MPTVEKAFSSAWVLTSLFNSPISRVILSILACYASKAALVLSILSLAPFAY
jgi:hypothetical protein